MSQKAVSREQSMTDGQQSAVVAQTCPLCEFVGDAKTEVYLHLQTSHRKSKLATALLERTDES